MKSINNKIDRATMTDPLIVKEICGNLKQMRLRKKLSQAQLAELAGLNRVTISRMEAGRAATMLTVVQVLRALGKLDILDMFRVEPEISPLKLLNLQEKQRKRVSSSRKKNSNDLEEKSQW